MQVDLVGSDADPVEKAANRHGLPFTAVLGLITGLAILVVSAVSYRDVDIYWHLMAGRELWQGQPPSALGTDWSYAPDPLPWISTQWLGEGLFHVLFTWGGWAALAYYRTLTAAIAVAILAVTTVRGHPAVLAAAPFVVGTVAIAAYSQERTQQLTYIGAAALGGVLVAALSRARLPRWWQIVPITVLWANLHGGWIILPMVFLLIAMGRWLDHGIQDGTGHRALGLAAVALLSGMISPAGLGNVAAVLRFADATDGVIQEWEPVAPTEDVGILTLTLWVIVLVAWRGSGRVPRSEFLVVVSLFIFGWMAWRTIVIAILLLAPLLAHRLAQGYPTMAQRREPRWSMPLGIGLACVLTAAALASIPSQEHLPVDQYPFGLYDRLAQAGVGNGSPERVLNDYNVAGMVLWFGGEAPQVAIDGRTDRYGAEYIKVYMDALVMQGDWAAVLDELEPTAALLDEHGPLDEELATEGWTVLGRENGYVLLTRPPGAFNWRAR